MGVEVITDNNIFLALGKKSAFATFRVLSGRPSIFFFHGRLLSVSLWLKLLKTLKYYCRTWKPWKICITTLPNWRSWTHRRRQAPHRPSLSACSHDYVNPVTQAASSFSTGRSTFIEWGRRIEVLHAAVWSHDQQFFILFIRRKDGCSVEMNNNQVMASATFLALLCKKQEDVLAFQKDLCDAIVVTESGERGWRPGWADTTVCGIQCQTFKPREIASCTPSLTFMCSSWRFGRGRWVGCRVWTCWRESGCNTLSVIISRADNNLSSSLLMKLT